MILLKLEHIDAGYGKKQVLFDISFNLLKGETAILIGANGSGKSTLIKTVYGLIEPWNSKGKIWFRDGEINKSKTSHLIKKGIIYIPQLNELFDDLTVNENLELSCIHNVPQKGLKKRIDEVLEQIPTLKSLLKQECYRLSGGERKQLSFGMALTNRPELIMFDEPLSGTSPKNTEDIIQLLIGLKKKGITLLVVEHRVKKVFELADRIIGLKFGRLFNKTIESLNDISEVML
ncbi:MAG: ATP-binding cassette domain-containing protein [Pseudomonadota bacterium]